MLNKKAFTLAEVLITLGIIGIVAAITIPTLITKYQKKVTVTRLKYAYSVLSQAIEQAEATNGDITNWNFDENVFEKYLMPNMKKVKKYNSVYGYNALGITYKQISGIPETGLAVMYARTIYILANGTQIFFYPTSTNSTVKGLIIDINGFSKPNQFGKDLFCFFITKEHKLHPMGRYSTRECPFTSEPNNDRNILKNSPCYAYACNKNSRGMWCGALIMTDNWKIAPDYPW